MGLKLDQLRCGHCQGKGHKSFDCKDKKDGCSFCGRPEAVHKGHDCFWLLQDRVWDEIQAKRGAINAVEKDEEVDEEEGQCRTVIGGLLFAIQGEEDESPGEKKEEEEREGTKPTDVEHEICPNGLTDTEESESEQESEEEEEVIKVKKLKKKKSKGKMVDNKNKEQKLTVEQEPIEVKDDKKEVVNIEEEKVADVEEEKKEVLDVEGRFTKKSDIPVQWLDAA